MDVKIVQRRELKVVCLEVVGRRDELAERVPEAWLELTRRLHSITGKMVPERFYGVTPESDHVAGGVYTYWVGTEVFELGRVPAGMTCLTLPAQAYAMATCRGGREMIESTYVGLARWLDSNGRRTRADGLGFELYDPRRQRPTPPYEGFDYDIYRPLA